MDEIVDRGLASCGGSENAGIKRGQCSLECATYLSMHKVYGGALDCILLKRISRKPSLSVLSVFDQKKMHITSVHFSSPACKRHFSELFLAQIGNRLPRIWIRIYYFKVHSRTRSRSIVAKNLSQYISSVFT